VAAPLPSTPSTSTFHCVVCDETYALVSVRDYDVHGDTLCHDCVLQGIVPLFHKALEHEFHYPVRYAGKIIDWRQFRDAPGEDFIARFQSRVIEYETPPSDRIYCQNFVRVLDKGHAPVTAEKLALRPEEIEEAKENGEMIEQCGTMVGRFSTSSQAKKLTCQNCAGLTCSICGGPVIAGDHGEDAHICNTTSEQNGLEGLTRGKEYQDCPKCGLSTELRDGCNHMTRPRCTTDYCFQCGKEARPGDDHWKAGGCLRWGQPGSERARHDLDDEDSDLEEVGPIAFGAEDFPPVLRDRPARGIVFR
jgi:hypothetical protein